ncbi:MAG: hypothetical protein ACI80P_001351 [Flavobacteriales bacterium]|jgi:hypothetical protein
MAWNEDNLKVLIDRFWEGETSIEEEALLRSRLQAEELPEEYEGVAAYFESLESPAELGEDFDAQILSSIKEETKVRKLNPRWWLAAAAMILTLLSGYWFFQPENQQLASEEYTQAEIQQAWAQTQIALTKIGVEINHAQKKTLKIKKFNEAKMAIQFGK